MTLKNHLTRLMACQSLWQVCLWVSAIAILFLATTSETYPVPSAPSDKINHLIAFLELAILARLGWPRARPWPTAIALLLFGVMIEVIQAPLPYREFSLLDILADGVGIAIGLLLWRGAIKIRALNQGY